MADPITLVIMFLVAIFIGILVTLGGIGGGPLLMPFFLLVLELEEYTAKGTSIFIILMSSGIASIVHFRNKRFSVRTAIILGGIATLGSITSTFIFDRVSVERDLFLLIFTLFLCYIVVKLLRSLIRDNRNDKSAQNKKTMEKTENNTQTQNGNNQEESFNCDILCMKIDLKKIIPLFFIIGFLSNFLGIGGGIFNTPILHTIYHYPIHFAAAESTAVLFVNSLYNFIIFAVRGQIDFVIGLAIGLGMVIGSLIGSSVAPKIPKRYISLTLIGLIVFTIFQIFTKIA